MSFTGYSPCSVNVCLGFISFEEAPLNYQLHVIALIDVFSKLIVHGAVHSDLSVSKRDITQSELDINSRFSSSQLKAKIGRRMITPGNNILRIIFNVLSLYRKINIHFRIFNVL